MSKNFFYTLLFLSAFSLSAQNENLIDSPYSLYGLGVHNYTQVGKWNGLGGAGMAFTSSAELNMTNPAAIGSIGKNSFLYDMGAKSSFHAYENKQSNKYGFTTNFSDIAIGFPLTKNMGMTVSLLPYSNVGYFISGSQTFVEGSTEKYTYTVNGSGGVNDFKLQWGYHIAKSFDIGFSSSFLFGNITEQNAITVDNNIFNIEQKKYYKGIRLGVGFQIQPTKSLRIGGIINSPNTLFGNSEKSIYKTVNGVEYMVSENINVDIENFYLPVEYGTGLSYSLLGRKIFLNADYTKKFWSWKTQKDNLGFYRDEDIINIGMDYIGKPVLGKFLTRCQYRIGYSYDSGYLELNNQKISDQRFSLGIGIPIGNHPISKMNISYSYGEKGILRNWTVKEKYHVITLNLSLENNWFKKTKIE